MKMIAVVAAVALALLLGAPAAECWLSRCGPVQVQRVCDPSGKCWYHQCQTCCYKSGRTISCRTNCWTTQN